MFGIGGTELFLILIFGFLIFGPDKLPAIAKTAAQAINKFRSAQEEMTKVIKTEVYDPNSEEPFKNPLDVLSKVTKSDKKEEETESFSERKAKYDKERAAKKAANERKEAREARAAAGASAQAAGSAAKEANKEVAATKQTSQGERKAKPTADELYGNKPSGVASQKTKPDVAKKTSAVKKPASTTKATTTKKGE